MAKRISKLTLGFLVVSIFLIYSYFLLRLKGEERNPSACIKNDCFFLEIANTPSERERGLMNRTELREDAGMLFVFEKEDEYKFWMKNTLIPLDMIWMDKEGKIVYIKENAEPCKADPCESFGPVGKAKYVLEINGGLVKKTGIKLNDIAILP